jgi:hypothetical protein
VREAKRVAGNKKGKGEIMEQKTDLSRRNFLKTSGGALVGGMVLGGIGDSLVAPRSAHAAEPLGCTHWERNSQWTVLNF